MKAAIIGGGVAGSTLLKGLLEHHALKPEDHITVFEPRPVLGAGMPYAPDDATLMLNSSPDTLSADRTDPLHFERWLAEHRPNAENFEGLIPRAVYGEYLNEYFKPYYNHPQVTVLHEHVDNVEVVETIADGPLLYKLSTQESGWGDTMYDALFLAVGHAPYKDPYQLDGSARYIGNPYPVSEQLSRIDSQARVGIIGSGATGIDLMRTLMQRETSNQPVTFYVKEKAFHMVHIPLEQNEMTFSFSADWIQRQLEGNGGRIPLRNIVNQIQADFEIEDIDGWAVYEKYRAQTLEHYAEAIDTWDQQLAYVQRYIQRMIPYMAQLYNSLSETDKFHYEQTYEASLQFFKSMVPVKTVQWMFDLMKEERLRIVTGLTEVLPKQGGTSFQVKAEKTEEVDWLINATGFEKTLTRGMQEQPLIRNLYHQRLILPAKNGRDILVDWPQTRMVSERFGAMDNAFFLGNWIYSTHYANNSAENIMDHARSLAEWFMGKRSRVEA